MIKRKKINKVVVLLPILLVTITIIFIMMSLKKENNEYTDNTKILSTITQVLDLNTVKYTYSNIVEVKKDKSINNIKIPFTEQSFIIKYNGVINGGVKPDNIDIVENDGKKIIVNIKECTILDHYIDDENLYVYDIKNSVFNRLDTNEILSDISKYKLEYEEKLLNEGFMEEIKNNTKASLVNLLKNIGYEEVEISFES